MSVQWKCYSKTLQNTWIRSLKSDTNLLVSDTIVPGLHMRFYAGTQKKVFYIG
jgi:hypothetical protein